MDSKTHLGIDARFSGRPVYLADGEARVELKPLPEMVADDRGLVHGGFVFSMADYAAMLAVNEPTVVLGAAQTKFLRPVVVGETLVAEARVDRRDGKKIFVKVVVQRAGDVVFDGEFTCFVPPKHVLDP